MEYLYFGFACLIFVLAVIGRGIYLDRKKAAEFEKSLRRDYGKLPKREISPERFLRMDRYFRKHPEKDQIDDITWNDLGMDEIFRGMNHTYSAIGEEYFYYTLRSPGHGAAGRTGESDRILFETGGFARFRSKGYGKARLYGKVFSL